MQLNRLISPFRILRSLETVEYYSTRSLEAGSFFRGCIKQRWPTSLFSLQMIQNRLLHSCFLYVIIAPHVPQHLRSSHAFFISTTCFLFMIIKARLTHKVSVTEVVRYSNPCGYTRGTGHTVATCLLACVYHVVPTHFVARLT